MLPPAVEITEVRLLLYYSFLHRKKTPFASFRLRGKKNRLCGFVKFCSPEVFIFQAASLSTVLPADHQMRNYHL